MCKYWHRSSSLASVHNHQATWTKFARVYLSTPLSLGGPLEMLSLRSNYIARIRFKLTGSHGLKLTDSMMPPRILDAGHSQNHPCATSPELSECFKDASHHQNPCPQLYMRTGLQTTTRSPPHHPVDSNILLGNGAQFWSPLRTSQTVLLVKEHLRHRLEVQGSAESTAPLRTRTRQVLPSLRVSHSMKVVPPIQYIYQK